MAGTRWPPRSPIVDAELVGAWGLSMRWSDGHDTGIYSWAALRDWWDAGLRGPLGPTIRLPDR